MIRDAGRFGFKIYYGDGTRLDVLRAAGAADVRLIAICIDDREAASRVVDLVHAEFPGVKLYRALLRPPPYAAAHRQGRRLQRARNLRVGAGARPQGARDARHRVRARRRRDRFRAQPRSGTPRPAAGRRRRGRHRPVAGPHGAGAVERARARSQSRSIRRRRRSSKATRSAAPLNRHIRKRSGRPSRPTARDISPAAPRPG